jgi:GxxExxY protein
LTWDEQGFLLDTNVTRQQPSIRVARWLEDTDDELMHISAIAVGEVCKAITVHPEAHRRYWLRRWLESEVRPRFAGRILPVTEAISARWGILQGEFQLRGIGFNAPDRLIAATALEHRLTVVTRTVKDFAGLGVAVSNPWGQLVGRCFATIGDMTDIEAAIREIANDVYNKLGSGHSEVIYRCAMEVGLRLRHIGYQSERPIEVKYEGHCVGRGQADLVVGSAEDTIIVELKAVPTALGPPEMQQLKNYMSSLGVKRGLLINFPQPSRPQRKITDPGPQFESV